MFTKLIYSQNIHMPFFDSFRFSGLLD